MLNISGFGYVALLAKQKRGMHIIALLNLSSAAKSLSKAMLAICKLLQSHVTKKIHLEPKTTVVCVLLHVSLKKKPVYLFWQYGILLYKSKVKSA